MEFTVQRDHFYLNGKKVFLNSGEIHYFRIRRDLWDKHLKAAAEAGLTAVSTYIPWAWHEPVEQIFDFDGSTCPERDLTGWFELCKSNGLFCIVKPGPFILAEYRGAGLPDWFLERFGDEVRMHNSTGARVQSDGVSLFNPRFFEKVTLWYDQIMPLIAGKKTDAGGPVIMMQICNEIGVFSWLAHQADYSSGVNERFIAYLKENFKTVSDLNRLWGTGYRDFDQIELPPDGNVPYRSSGDRGRDAVWHGFWRSYYGDYLRLLTRMSRERGVNVPVYHNLPGWIYGHGYEFPVNITMYDDLFGDRSEIIFGVDHIPEFSSHRNMHDDRIINDITRAMQGEKPLFAAEFQCGSREYHVVTNPRELELFYKASIANGLTGWNYYMFSQGMNPERKGYSGSTFYWFTPLTAEGERTSTFPLVKRMSRLINTLENILVNARRKAGICVLFYPPYYATELERTVSENCGLTFVPSAIRRPAYFDGLLKALQVLNIDYDMADLSKVTAEFLKNYGQVWAFSCDEMNAADQQTILEYVTAGGSAVLFPYLPDREVTGIPCTVIRDALNIAPAGKEIFDSPLIDLFDLKDIKCANPQVIYPEELPGGYETVARTLKGSVCGFSASLGKGSLIHLGTWLGFDTEGHKTAYEAILERSKATLRQASADNGFLTVRERFTDDKRALVFIGNYYNEDHTGRISYTHPGTGETVSVPFASGQITWPPLYAIVIPVCLELTDGLMILHSTSDILGIEVENDQCEIILYGDRDLPGEIVFEGAALKQIKSAALNGIPIEAFQRNDCMIFNYNHLHKKEMLLSVKMDGFNSV